MDVRPGRVRMPSGTVTFLFTDVETSTRLWAADRDAMSASLRLHDAIVRDAIESYSGFVFSTAGDSFAAAFGRASDAVRAAQHAQEALAMTSWPGPPLRVRIGLHLGEAEERGNDYFGPVVNTAARVGDAAHGGQILLTEAVRSTAAATGVIDLGVHRLRDVSESLRLFQLGADEFPPLRTVAPRLSNLPSRPTRLFGREVDIANVRDLLLTNRLVTITAPGGSGKTRLALAVGEAELIRRADGVWLVDLTAVTNGSDVPGAIAKAVRLTLGAGDATDQVVDCLKDQSALLILDNCEHVIDAGAEFAERFLEVDGASAMLATSREALDVDGERIVVLGTLPSTTSDSPGVQMFVDRAMAVDPRFALTVATSECIAAICTRLDGLPLAIELAAARVTVMTPSELLAALDDRFEVLSGGRRRQRQRTLKATLDWSYDLLDGEEQRVLRVCGVFVDGFDVEAVAAVAEIPRTIATQVIAALVAKSLVAPVDHGARSRFGLLETVREYARRRLTEAGEEDHVRSSHLEYFHRLAYAHGRAVFGEMRHGVLLRPDRNNLTAAFEWAAVTGRWVTAGELIVGGYGAYVFDGYLPEATTLIERAIEACEPLDPELAGYLRAVTVQTLGWTGDRASYIEVCRRLTMSSVPVLRVFGWALHGYTATFSEPDEARRCHARASAELESATELSPAVEAEIAGMLTYIPAVLAAYAGDHATGLRHARQALATQEASDYRNVLTVSATQLSAACEIVLGDPLGALRTLATLDPFDLTFFDGDDIRALACMALGELDEARRCVRNHAERATTGPVSGQACDSALLMAALAHAEGDTEIAIELLLHMGIGRHAATRMYSAEFARRLGVASDFTDRQRQALSYGRDSEQGSTGAHMATAVVRRELIRRGWS